MNYKNKYLKYKLKYLNQKKLLGGMVALELDGEESPENDFNLDTLEIPGAPGKQKLSSIIINLFKTRYENTVPNGLKLYAANERIFNYKIDKDIKELIWNIYTDWTNIFITVSMAYPDDFPEGQRDELSIMTYENLVNLAMYHIWYLASQKFATEPLDKRTFYNQQNQQPIGEVLTGADNVRGKLFGGRL